jgi:sulfur carrier protein ThiS
MVFHLAHHKFYKKTQVTKAMKIFIEKENRARTIKFSGKLISLLVKLKINPQTVIVTKNNELITTDDKLSDKDSVQILSVVSGG